MKLPVSMISRVAFIFTWVYFTSPARDSTSFESINWINHPKLHSKEFGGLCSLIVARDLKSFNKFQTLYFSSG